MTPTITSQRRQSALDTKRSPIHFGDGPRVCLLFIFFILVNFYALFRPIAHRLFSKRWYEACSVAVLQVIGLPIQRQCTWDWDGKHLSKERCQGDNISSSDNFYVYFVAHLETRHCNLA